MEDTFQISNPSDKSLGDYLSFTIADRDGTLPARISGTAIRKLAGVERYDSAAVFMANKEKIREVAYKHRRVNPGLAVIMLSEIDFS
jgi:hypothetical protein